MSFAVACERKWKCENFLVSHVEKYLAEREKKNTLSQNTETLLWLVLPPFSAVRKLKSNRAPFCLGGNRRGATRMGNGDTVI